MQGPDLELIATRELVDELIRRKTFLGIVIHAQDDFKDDWRGERTFSVHHNANLTGEQVYRLLDTIADQLDRASE